MNGSFRIEKEGIYHISATFVVQSISTLMTFDRHELCLLTPNPLSYISLHDEDGRVMAKRFVGRKSPETKENSVDWVNEWWKL